MLTTLAHLGMAAHLLALALLFLVSAPAIRAARRTWVEKLRAPAPATLPKLALIVPLTGNAPGMRGCLASLLNQSGPPCDTYFVVRDEADPATALVRELMSGAPHAHLVVAGPASTCCQKNHSLLTGIEEAGEAPEILVFCDSTHEAAPDFLVRLTAPILAGRCVLSTAYHRVVPGDSSLFTLCQYFCALGIHLLQSVPLLCQPWGGATAIRRGDFFAHGVDAVWARGIVDDFTMGPYLQSRGVRALAVPEASLVTRLAGQNMRAWLSWWFRQLLYLKFCMPLTWAAATLGIVGLGFSAGWAVLDAVTGGGAGWLYLAGLAVLGVAFGRLAQTRPPAWRLALAFLVMQAVSVPCYLATWGTNTLGWRGISYKAGLDGRVRAIIRSGP
ncbi:MAG TPA: glycosyltransferase [Humidesulfovibrio sp.]|uniref:glycosyltransferase n=1 Tax=Humidesulfovibrio sp. TaxID=2910988 RepID=UPI002C84E967|nr:glycosyltransferase [Humidesulfovibrio sp.]HWR04149.1 glycosyltransferase [Humidesulfovibrio sp.]